MKSFYINRTVITMEDDALYAEAVCAENGKILAVGDQDEIMKLYEEQDEIIDLHGGAMLPGFIDGHSHFVGVANAMRQCDLSSCESFQDIIDTMKDFKDQKDLPEGAWLTGCNYDHNFLKEGRHPNREALDQISTENPVLLIHASSHMGVTNSKGLQLQGIDEHTEDTSDGRYGRMEGTQIPDGYMEEKAFLSFQSGIPAGSPQELMNLIVEAQKIYSSYGITTVQDGMVGKPLFQLLKAASDMGLLHLDVVGYLDITTASELIEEENDYTGKYHNHLKMGGYKIFLDGSPQGKTAWLTEPYQGEQEYCGYPIYTDEQAEELVEEAVQDNRQLLAHCNGDAAAEQYLNACCKVGDTAKIRPVMIHAQLLRPDQLPKVKRAGMIPSYFVAHTWFWGDIHLKNLGEKRAKKISPLRSTADMGIVYTLHQDTPVIPPDMMRTIWCAVNRKSKQGCSMGQEERISVQQALKGVTINAAYQYFEEGEKGSIKKGKAADFVLLSENPLTVSSDRICEVRVLATFYRGEKVYSC